MTDADRIEVKNVVHEIVVRLLADKILGISDVIDSAGGNTVAGLADIADSVHGLRASVEGVECFHVDMVPHVWVHKNRTKPESWTVWIGESKDTTFRTKTEAEDSRREIHAEILEHWGDRR